MIPRLEPHRIVFLSRSTCGAKSGRRKIDEQAARVKASNTFSSISLCVVHIALISASFAACILWCLVSEQVLGRHSWGAAFPFHLLHISGVAFYANQNIHQMHMFEVTLLGEASQGIVKKWSQKRGKFSKRVPMENTVNHHVTAKLSIQFYPLALLVLLRDAGGWVVHS